MSMILMLFLLGVRAELVFATDNCNVVVDFPQSPVKVHLGSAVILKCDYTISGDCDFSFISWCLQDVTSCGEIVDISDSTVHWHNYQDRYDVQGKSLYISSAETQHQAQYTCTIASTRRTESGSFDLVVLVPLKSHPKLDETTNNGTKVSVTRDVEHEFSCEVTGTLPAATFEWYIGGTDYGPGTLSESTSNGLIDTKSTLAYTPRWKIDQGSNVICQATNEATTSMFSTYITMDILAPPNATIQSFNDGDYYSVNEDQENILTCISTGKPAPSIEWFIGNDPLESSPSTTPIPNLDDGDLLDVSNTLSFTPQWLDHHKWLKCEADNAAIGQSSSKVRLDVNVSAKYILISDNAKSNGYGDNDNVIVVDSLEHNLTCTTYGTKPATTIDWNADGLQMHFGETTPFANGTDSRLYNTRRTAVFTPRWSHHGKTVSCEGRNIANTNNINTYVNLDVQVSPRTSILQKSPAGILQVINGTQKIVFCDAVGARPESSIQWMLGSDAISGNENVTNNAQDNKLQDTKSKIILTPLYEIHQNMSLICVASNLATDKKSEPVEDEANLDIFVVPTEVKIENSYNGNITTVANKQSNILCTATSAHPAANLSWKLGTTNVTDKATSRISWESDGRKDTNSLLIITPKKEDFGKKLECSAHHAVYDSPSTKSAYIIVKYSAEIMNREQDERSADQGQTANLLCIASGYPIPKVRWFKLADGNSTEVVLGTKRINISEEYNYTSRYVRSSLIIMNVDPYEDYTIYTCEAGNEIGNTTLNITLAGNREPDTPMEFTVIDDSITWKNITVTWRAGYNGGMEQHYIVGHRIPGTVGHESNDIPEYEDHYTITDLQPDTTYEIYIISCNTIDCSDPSETVTVSTKGAPDITEPGTRVEDNTGLYAGIGSAIFVLFVIAVILVILILRNRTEGPKYLKKSSILETTFDGVDNPVMPYTDNDIHGGHSHERESTTKEGNAYIGGSDQSYKGKTNKTDEASTSFAVYAAPDKAKKKKNLDSHPDDTPYANVTGPSTQHEPPFLTNGTDGASPYANFKEMNGNKKEPDTAYADVQMAKPEKGRPPAGGKGKKPQRKGKKATAYQAEKPYDDVPDETGKNVKPLSSSQENPYEVAAMTVQKPKPQDANVEGLTYADLDFKGGPKTKTKPKPPVKPTEDDAVAYAAVDFSKTVKPN